MDATNFLAYWRRRIEKDLSPFIDPGTTLELEGETRVLTARWTARSIEREAIFSIALDAGVRVSFLGRELSYAALYATPEMADLKSLAKMILQSHRHQVFVPTRARRTDLPEGTEGAAVEMLQSTLSSEQELGATRIIMVTGEAGAGKTQVLQELVRRQASAYNRGQSEILYLYVNAQGRALARFNEALATELQDLRAAVTYHAVSTLVRNGILVPIIDGFDELLGVGGFDEAFNSLALFMEELDGEGQIVASARSTYYEQEFLSRANRVSSLGSQFWVQVPVEVLAWGELEFDTYLHKYVEAHLFSPERAQQITTIATRVFAGSNEQFKSKPLFVARAVDLVASGEDIPDGANLLDQLVAAYLERERKEKLLSRTGEPLLSSEQISMLLTTLAEEMWNQETRELDRLSVREIAEYVLVTNGVDEAEQRVVIERMPTAAFLMPGESKGSITFEHELFFSYFLGRAFTASLKSGTGSMAVLLGRSVLPREVAAVTTRLAMDTIRRIGPQPIITTLSQAAGKESPRALQVRENAGILVSHVLRSSSGAGIPLENLSISKITFPGSELGDVTVVDSTFESVSFRRADLSRSKFLQCEARNCLFFEVLIDPEYSRLELKGLDADTQVAGIRVRENSSVKLLYSPVEIRRVLQLAGAIASEVDPMIGMRPIRQEVLGIVERLMRAYNRTNPVCTADDNLKSLFGNQLWPQVQRALQEFRIVSLEHRGTGGPPKDFLRRQFLPDQIMKGVNRTVDVPPEIREFWSFMEDRYAISEESAGVPIQA